jgi:hypothetical protein
MSDHRSGAQHLPAHLTDPGKLGTQQVAQGSG